MMIDDDIAIVIGLLAEDRDTIPYRSRLAKVLSVTSAILLQQIVYWWDKSGRQPFYKFKEPCDHKLYREGDSWCEELAFTRREFDTALKHIATRKLATTTLDQAARKDKPVIYWTDRGRVTHYTVNTSALIATLRKAYSLKAENAFSKSTKAPLAKGANELYQKAETAFISTETTRDYTDRESAARPPAVLVFHQVTNRYPVKALWPDVAQAVGDDPADLDFWRAVVKAWLGCGWNPQNVGGMLEYYRRREIPTTGSDRRGGHRKESTWTKAELEKARARSLALEPLDPAVFLEEET